MSPLTKLKQRLFPPTKLSPDQAERAAILRRQRLLTRAGCVLPYIRTLLILAGFIYILALPFPGQGKGKQGGFLGRGHYVSENALQPGQVNTYWNWADVHVADNYARLVDGWAEPGVASRSRADAIQAEFQKLGLPTATQSYSFKLGGSNSTVSGVNSYAILQAPKTDGAEALVLSASWISRATDSEGEAMVNRRGVAMILAMANYLKKYSTWSKDIILLVSDGYEDGAQAWLDAYHGYGQTNLRAEELSLTTGPIWAGLNLDYAYHSFSHVGLFFEGANGHLPNLDFLNAASHILRHSSIHPVLHADIDLADANRGSEWLPNWLDVFGAGEVAAKYERAALNLLAQICYGASGQVSGPEGVYGRYRIDAITFYAIPAEGPHGFHSLGKAVESTLRSLNNLLERFHQSFFLYIMTSVDTFISVGNYLAAPVLVSAGMTITGLSIWNDHAIATLEGGKSTRTRRPVGSALLVIALTHAFGVGLWHLVAARDPLESPSANSYTFGMQLLVIPLSLAMMIAPSRKFLNVAPLAPILKSFTLILGGLTIAVCATLNFGLACLLAVVLGPALTLAGASHKGGLVQQGALVALSPPVMWRLWRAVDENAAEAWLMELLKSWSVVGGWSIDLGLVVVVPLLLQAGTVVALQAVEDKQPKPVAPLEPGKKTN